MQMNNIWRIIDIYVQSMFDLKNIVRTISRICLNVIDFFELETK